MFKDKYALISVSDKTNLDFLVDKLVNDFKFNILATESTYKYLSKLGINNLIHINDYIGEDYSIFNNRIKSMNSRIYIGILADYLNDQQLKYIYDKKIFLIDLVVVNFYPFEWININNKCNELSFIDSIDVGGPTAIRAAAKNFIWSLPVVSPSLYMNCISILKRENERYKSITLEKRYLLDLYTYRSKDTDRLEMSYHAFNRLNKYDKSISNFINYTFLNKEEDIEVDYLEDKDTNNNLNLPKSITLHLKKSKNLHYGENSHQKAALYKIDNIQTDQKSIYSSELSLDYDIVQHSGNKISYNNYLDIHYGLDLIKSLNDSSVIILKHGIPAVASSKQSCYLSYKSAILTDPISIFGGVVIVKGTVDKRLATLIASKFYVIVAAVSYTDTALEILSKRINLIIITFSVYSDGFKYQLRSTNLGILIQEWNSLSKSELLKSIELKTSIDIHKSIDKDQFISGILFAYSLVTSLRSNAIAITNSDTLLGYGVGQPNRIQSVNLAIQHLKKYSKNIIGDYLIVASDGFFPFKDSIESIKQLYSLNVKSIVILQPGGSKRDSEVIRESEESNIPMYFIKYRAFLH